MNPQPATVDSKPLTVKAIHALGHALSISGSMTWAILWALDLGIRVFPPSSRPSSGDPPSSKGSATTGPKSLAVATGFGAASSSCSYAAVALARSLFRKGASFTSAMAFEIASTNLVIELGIVLALLIGWQFTAAEFVGGPIMIVLLALLFRVLLRQRLVDEARTQADRGRGRFHGGTRRHGHVHPTVRIAFSPAPFPDRRPRRSPTSSSWSGRR